VNKITTFINSIKLYPSGFSKDLPKPGVYHFYFNENGEKSRVHLRVDPDNSGLLIVNASRIIHLNSTALFMAYLIFQNTGYDQAIRLLSNKFDVPKDQIINDYTQTIEKIRDLVRPDGACPIHDLDLEITAPFSSKPSAPYRMDLAVTYRCNNDCFHCYNARPRNYPELTTADWNKILDLLWNIGIPHIVFTGGEPTLREDLPELIAHAEQLGQITGINTNGRRLSDRNYVDSLVKAGLDHVQITLESHSPVVHDAMVNAHGAWNQTISGIRNVLETSLYVMTNTTMLTDNSPFLKETLEFLARNGVPTVGLNALIYSGRGLSVNTGLDEKQLPYLLDIAREVTYKNNQRLIWYTPTQYCNFDPMLLELGIKSCTAAMYNMCIEPNGDVIPCQSYYQSLGNILTASWSSIWNHDLSVNLRERKNIQSKCSGCSLLGECGGGCPLVMRIM
jgi:radical SAM protein with 4Fe4S-binding SPASM domain